MSSALGFPDFQRITQWFGRPLDQAAAAAIGAGQIVVGPLDVRTFASVVVCVKPTGGTVTVTVDQLVPAGPAALVVSSSFVVNDGNVIFEAFVLLAGEVRVTFQGAAPGETLAYAIVPANTNTNAEVAALTQLGFQHNDLVVATETAIDLEDDARIGFTFLDDPANLRMKITPVLRQNGAVTGSLYRWDGAAWTPTANVLADDANRALSLGADVKLSRTIANVVDFGSATLAVKERLFAATAGAVALSSLVTTDANERFQLYANGTLKWGPGSATQDVGLIRSAGATLDLTDAASGLGSLRLKNLTSFGVAAGNPAFQSFLSSADPNPVFRVEGDGKVRWGAGGASAVDVALSRLAAAALGTDGSMAATLGFVPPASAGTAIFAADASGGSTIALANNGTATPFGGNFGGLVLVHELGTDGDIAIFLVGSNMAVLVASSSGNHTVTAGTAGKTNFYNNAGAITLQNMRGGARTYLVYAVRTRVIA